MICLSNFATQKVARQENLCATQLALLLDMIAMPVFILNRERILVYANEAGHEKLQKGNIVQLRCGRFHLKATTHDTLKFEETVRNVTAGSNFSDRQSCMAVIDSDDVRISITTLPFRNLNHGEIMAAVILTAEDQSEDKGTLRLQHMLNLTCAEARVAYYISAGVRLVQIADQLEVSINTVKTHLASIFSKTGCADQSALSVMGRKLLTPIRNNSLDY
jgi:DNA-binding CsgD family transcriptional regulator